VSLKKAASSGVKFTAISSLAIAALQFAQLAILLRLLGPEDFGLLSMLMVVIGFARIYNDIGISNAIIYNQTISTRQLSSLFWLNLAMGMVLCLIVSFASPLIVWFYHEPKLQVLVILASVIFLITPFGQQFQSLFQKNLEFKILASIETFSSVLGVSLSILLAYQGFGVLSFIWGQLLESLVKAGLFFIKGVFQENENWRPTFYFNWREIKPMLSFGAYQMGDRSIGFMNANLDQLLIGSLLGATSLGYYTLAFNLIFQPFMKINPILTRVAFPVFAKVQGDESRLRQGYFTLLRLLTFVNIPLMLGIVAVSDIFVPLVFGEKWLPAIALIQVMAWIGIFRATMNPIGSLLLAKGKADLSFRWNAVVAVCLLSTIYLGIWLGGLYGVPVALLIFYSISFFVAYVVLVQPIIGKGFFAYVKNILPNLVIASATAALVFLVPRFFGQEGYLVLSVQVVVGIASYLLMNMLFQRKLLQEIIQIVRNK